MNNIVINVVIYKERILTIIPEYRRQFNVIAFILPQSMYTKNISYLFYYKYYYKVYNSVSLKSSYF